MEKANIVLLIGRPGCGKGTQAKLLSEKLRWIRLSSGDRIKGIRDGNEPFSERVRAIYDKGTLLPDWFADYILERGLLELDPHVGIVCEGFGRTKNQAEHFMDIVEWLGRSLVVVNLEVPDEEVRRRMLERATVENRPDSDGIQKIDERLAQYRDLTAPALEFFRTKGVVVDIDGTKTREDIADDIAVALQLA